MKAIKLAYYVLANRDRFRVENHGGLRNPFSVMLYHHERPQAELVRSGSFMDCCRALASTKLNPAYIDTHRLYDIEKILK